jgi:hypothetical protein
VDLEEGKRRQFELFTEHLPYELAMLDAATDFLSRSVSEDPSREGWFRRQSGIEAFWVHARLLIEFFTQPRNPNMSADQIFVADFQANHASAKDFAEEFESAIGAGTHERLVKDKINPQVAHINYRRETDSLKKLGLQVDLVKAQIDEDVKNFVDKLDPKWKEVWSKTEWWQKRQPVRFSWAGGQPSTTSVFQSWMTTITPAVPSENFEMRVNLNGTTTYSGS